MATKKLLIETLDQLSPEEFDDFKSLSNLRSRLKAANTKDVAELMMEKFDQDCVKETRKVLMMMSRTDLVQRLSGIGSGTKEKRLLPLTHRVEMMASVIELLLETLAGLRDWELTVFRENLQSQMYLLKLYSDITWWSSETADLQDTVFGMVQTLGRRTVETTKKVLIKMNRTDLVHKLSDSSSGPEEKQLDEHLPALILKVATAAAVRDLLVETLEDLSEQDLREFTWFLQFTRFQENLPQIPQNRQHTAELVNQMVERCGQRSVEVTREVFMGMNRTDLVQRLPETSSGPREKQSVDERWPALIHTVETMASVIELLLETLAGLRDKELRVFNRHLQSQMYLLKLDSDITWRLSKTADLQDTVFIMGQTLGRRTVETTKKVLIEMNRTDLELKLSDSSSGPEEKPSVDERRSALIHKVATVAAVKELLLETLEGLSDEEFNKFMRFLQLIIFQRNLPHFSDMFSIGSNRASIVDPMVRQLGQQSVEVTREVLMNMKRTDLAQKLPVTSSEKHSVDEPGAALVTTEEELAAVRKVLLETLKRLNQKDLKTFWWFLQFTNFQKGLRQISWYDMEKLNTNELVDHMVDTFGEESVEVTREVFMDMKRTDLVQKLPETSSGPKEKPESSLFQTEVTMASAEEKLVETLKDLSDEEFEDVKRVLEERISKRGLPRISRSRLETADRAEVVQVMVQMYSQQSVEFTMEALQTISRTDLVQRLSDISSASKEKPSVDEQLSAQMQKAATITTDRERILETLEDLKQEEFEKFKWFLQGSDVGAGLPVIPKVQLEKTSMCELVDLMLQTYSRRTVEVTKKVFKKICRDDLVQKLSETSSGPGGPSRSSEPDGGGSSVQDSSDWTPVEPEVIRTDADEAPTYSLQSAAGHFECSVSGLRWVCQVKTSLKYQFWCWEGHMQWMESLGYMPAGPLMDVTVTGGKLNEVHLPHWICTEDNPEILDKFATLHVTDCGDVVDKVCEVTASHVKLAEPDLSAIGVLFKLGVPFKAKCNVLMYKSDKAFLTLHIYLIPCDPGLQQEMKQLEKDYEYKLIRSPHPEKSLRLRDRFILTADLDDAEISPETLKLRYESSVRMLNFFQVYIDHPETDFQLQLRPKTEPEPVWTCVVHKGDYQSSGRSQGIHFVDTHQCDLIDRVSNIRQISDNLLRAGVIQQEKYDEIMATPTTQEKMRKLYSGPLKAGGRAAKDVFYTILEEKEPFLVADLKSGDS